MGDSTHLYERVTFNEHTFSCSYCGARHPMNAGLHRWALEHGAHSAYVFISMWPDRAVLWWLDVATANVHQVFADGTPLPFKGYIMPTAEDLAAYKAIAPWSLERRQATDVELANAATALRETLNTKLRVRPI